MTAVYGSRKFGETGPNAYKPLQSLNSMPLRVDPVAKFSRGALEVNNLKKYRDFVCE